MNQWKKTLLGDLISIKGGFSYKTILCYLGLPVTGDDVVSFSSTSSEGRGVAGQSALSFDLVGVANRSVRCAIGCFGRAVQTRGFRRRTRYPMAG